MMGGVPPALLTSAAHGDTEVLRLLERRRDTGRRPGRHADGARIALVVGGGGMRGSYAAGMVHALSDLGLAAGVDEVWGSSAGAFVGTALVMGHGAEVSRVFERDMACREFIDPRRFGTRRPMVSLDHLFDRILVDSLPTDWSRLVDPPVPLNVVVTGAVDLRPRVLTALPDGATWRTAMRATAAIPLLAGPPVRVGTGEDAEDFIDGSVGDPLPVARALRDGATHVLALLTRTADDLTGIPPDARTPLWARSLDRLAPGLGRMAQDASRHGECLPLLADAAHPDRAGAHLLTLSPHSPAGVHGLSTDPGRVAAAARIGYETVLSATAPAAAA